MFDDNKVTTDINVLLANAIDTMTFLEELIPSIGNDMNHALQESISLGKNLDTENQVTFLIKYSEYASHYKTLELARGIYSRLNGSNFEPFPMLTLDQLIENIKQEQGGLN